MRIKQNMCWIIKAVAAFLLAFLILNGISYFYYFIPYNMECKTGATDFVFPSNFRGFNGEEGICSIKIDSNGYNNQSVPEKINILCMGSSHTLAYTVNPDEGYPAILNSKLQDENGMSAYNIGMFGHDWYCCINNLEAALAAFTPSDYIVVETFYSKYEVKKLKKLNASKYGVAGSVASKSMQLIKKIPFLQLAGHQIKSMFAAASDESITVTESTDNKITKEYKDELDITFNHISELVSEKGCKFVYLYHPDVKVDKEGKAYTDTEEEYLLYTKELCQKYDFIFVDMTQRFMDEYENSYILPRGFSNTKIGYGHINKYAHAMIADELYEIVMEEEGK